MMCEETEQSQHSWGDGRQDKQLNNGKEQRAGQERTGGCISIAHGQGGLSDEATLPRGIRAQAWVGLSHSPLSIRIKDDLDSS